MNNTRSRIGDIEFEVRSRLGIIQTYPTGWTKELNIISWNGGTPKYDLRDWNPDHSNMSKGITLHEEEALKLKNILDARFARPSVKGRGWETAENADVVEKERQEGLAAVGISSEEEVCEKDCCEEKLCDDLCCSEKETLEETAENESGEECEECEQEESV